MAMADQGFSGTARELREATAISLGFGTGSDTNPQVGVGTSMRPYPTETTQADWAAPDAGALEAARARLSDFFAKIIVDERTDRLP